MHHEAELNGFSIDFISTDCASNQMCPMKHLVEFGTVFEENQFSFPFNPHGKYQCNQDPTHNINRAKSRLMNDESELFMGDMICTVNHLKILVDSDNFSKLDHGLYYSDVNSNDLSRDKMDFNSTMRMMHKRVRKCLRLIVGSEGTETYLMLMSFLFDAFINENESDNTRLYKSMYVTDFFRIWRGDLEAKKKFSAENFITQQTWESIELSNGFLYHLYQIGKASLITICNSQHCEKTFRNARAMSSSGLTDVNFSCHDFVRRIKNIQSIDILENELKKYNLNFPSKHQIPIEKVSDSDEDIDEIPNLEGLNAAQIISTVQKAVWEKALKLGMQINNIELKNFFKKPNLRQNLTNEMREYSKKYYNAYDCDFEDISISDHEVLEEHVIFKNLKILNEPIGKKNKNFSFFLK
jgi:hypothetical protein